jgi:hypothetical protein
VAVEARERRSEHRRTYRAPINFILKGTEDRLLRGVVINISMSGLGIYLFEPLSTGQEIVLKSLLPGRHVVYTICWCKQIADGFYQAGMRMVE